MPEIWDKIDPARQRSFRRVTIESIEEALDDAAAVIADDVERGEIPVGRFGEGYADAVRWLAMQAVTNLAEAWDVPASAILSGYVLHAVGLTRAALAEDDNSEGNQR